MLLLMCARCECACITTLLGSAAHILLVSDVSEGGFISWCIQPV